MEWPFSESVEKLQVACVLPLSATVLQIVVVPSLNVTVPVGATENCGLTVAVKATDCPNTEAFGEEVSAVEVEAWFTVWETPKEVLLLKLVSLG